MNLCAVCGAGRLEPDDSVLKNYFCYEHKPKDAELCPLCYQIKAWKCCSHSFHVSSGIKSEKDLLERFERGKKIKIDYEKLLEGVKDEI